MNNQELVEIAKKILLTIDPKKMDSLISELEGLPKCRRKASLPKLFNRYADRSAMNNCSFEDKMTINAMCHKCIVNAFEGENIID